MKKGQTVIIDGHLIGRISSTRGHFITVNLEQGGSMKVLPARLAAAIRPAERSDVYPGAELIARTYSGLVQVEIVEGDLRYVSGNSWRVLARDALRGETKLLTLGDLLVDHAARIRSASAED